jgi:hypothetical protein
MDTRKNRLSKGVERFPRQFAEQPMQALSVVLPAAELKEDGRRGSRYLS